MSAEKRLSGLTELMHVDTKEFNQSFPKKYESAFRKYQLGVYEQFIKCYQSHITPTAVETLRSDAMLDYYECYKSVLRKTKHQNKRLYNQGMDIERNLKYCLEIKSNFARTKFDFEQQQTECIQSYKQKYEDLYREVFIKQPQQQHTSP